MSIRRELRWKLTSLRYKLSHWFFRWTTDADGAITLTIANCLNFTKYKEHTVIRWGRNWRPAPKHVAAPYSADDLEMERQRVIAKAQSMNIPVRA